MKNKKVEYCKYQQNSKLLKCDVLSRSFRPFSLSCIVDTYLFNNCRIVRNTNACDAQSWICYDFDRYPMLNITYSIYLVATAIPCMSSISQFHSTKLANTQAIIVGSWKLCHGLRTCDLASCASFCHIGPLHPTKTESALTSSAQSLWLHCSLFYGNNL